MTRAITWKAGIWGAIALLALATGCAKSPEAEEPLPRHPFPTWVSHLETGETDVDEVHAIFGDPREITERHRGGTIWRYRYSEIHWSPDDPDRPEIAADGTRTPRAPSWRRRVIEGARAFGRFLDGLVYYPGSQPGPPSRRRLPATAHALELVFGVDGKLHRYTYAPRPEVVLVRRGR